MSVSVHDLAETVRIRRRGDLAASIETHAGGRRFLVKDPLRLQYFRFSEDEWFLLQQLDGRRSLEEARSVYSERPDAKIISVRDVEGLARRAIQLGLASVETAEVGQRLYERRRRQRWRKLLQIPQTVLSLRVPLCDPDRFLGATLPAVRWLFAPLGVALALTLIASSALLVFMNWDAFVAKLPTAAQFFTWWNLGQLWLALAIAKIIHEFGHGWACKRFGGEVHELGAMLLIFSPCLYCSVSDAARLPNKWHRAAIGAAGVYFELVAAAVAVWLWWFSTPGLLHAVCMDIAVVSSIHTLIFNANPLIRFDGYYILSDLVGVPNLLQRANRRAGNLASRATFGVEAAPDPYRPGQGAWRYEGTLAAFAVASFAYRFAVSFGFIFLLSKLLRPHGLMIIAWTLGILALIGVVVAPLIRTGMILRNRWPAMRIRPTRATVGVAVAATILAVVFLTPFPMHVDYPFIVRLRNPANLYVNAPGRLLELNIADGQPVAGGEEVARLENLGLDREYQTAATELARERDRAKVAERFGDAVMAAEAEDRCRALAVELELIDRNRRLLSIRIPHGTAGTAVGVPLRDKLGKLFQAGELFCQVGDPTRLEAFIVAADEDAALIAAGAAVWLKAPGHQGSIPQSQVTRVAALELKSAPVELTAAAGGALATTSDDEDRERKGEAKTGPPTLRPLVHSFSLLAPIDDDAHQFRVGLRGVARVAAGDRTLAWRIDRYLRQTFHFKL